MTDITKIRGFRQEAKFIRERAFNLALLEVFARQRKGTSEERQAVKELYRRLGPKIYAEAFFLLAHKICDEKKARKLFLQVLDRQKEMTLLLKRPISLQVAAVDYLQQIGWLEKPLLIEENKSFRIAKNAMMNPVEAPTVPTHSELPPLLQKTEIRGVPVVPGLAVGHVFRYQDLLSRELKSYDIEEAQLDGELERLETAIQKMENDLLSTQATVEQQVGASKAAVFDAHRLMLRDAVILDEIREELDDQRINIEHAVRQVFRRWERKFKDSSAAIAQDKALDLADIGRRLLRELLGIRGNVLSHLPSNSIIFAKRLLPSDTVHLDRSNAKGIVTEEGGPNSHVAILANAFGIPLISKVDLDLDRVQGGCPVIMDGTTGRVMVNSDDAVVEAVKREKVREDQRQEQRIRRFDGVRLEKNGQLLKVSANVSGAEECAQAKKCGADSIGLYRIEQFYMSSTSMPSEENLFESLNQSLEPMRGKQVTLRLLDIGGDKTLPYIDLVERINPALGVRGVRLLLRFRNLLQTQLRVFLKLSARFNLRILVPMVTIPGDMLQVRRELESEKGKLRELKIAFNEELPLGAMIETPAAALTAAAILRIADFLSVGTNDLLQYTMAADRENMSVSEYYAAGQPLVVRWVGEIARQAQASRKELEVCGELAGYPEYLQSLLAAGVCHFSVAPHLVPRVKENILNKL